MEKESLVVSHEVMAMKRYYAREILSQISGPITSCDCDTFGADYLGRMGDYFDNLKEMTQEFDEVKEEMIAHAQELKEERGIRKEKKRPGVEFEKEFERYLNREKYNTQKPQDFALQSKFEARADFWEKKNWECPDWKVALTEEEVDGAMGSKLQKAERDVEVLKKKIQSIDDFVAPAYSYSYSGPGRDHWVGELKKAEEVLAREARKKELKGQLKNLYAELDVTPEYRHIDEGEGIVQGHERGQKRRRLIHEIAVARVELELMEEEEKEKEDEADGVRTRAMRKKFLEMRKKEEKGDYSRTKREIPMSEEEDMDLPDLDVENERVIELTNQLLVLKEKIKMTGKVSHIRDEIQAEMNKVEKELEELRQSVQKIEQKRMPPPALPEHEVEMVLDEGERKQIEMMLLDMGRKRAEYTGKENKTEEDEKAIDEIDKEIERLTKQLPNEDVVDAHTPQQAVIRLLSDIETVHYKLDRADKKLKSLEEQICGTECMKSNRGDWSRREEMELMEMKRCRDEAAIEVSQLMEIKRQFEKEQEGKRAETEGGRRTEKMETKVDKEEETRKQQEEKREAEKAKILLQLEKYLETRNALVEELDDYKDAWDRLAYMVTSQFEKYKERWRREVKETNEVHAGVRMVLCMANKFDMEHDGDSLGELDYRLRKTWTPVGEEDDNESWGELSYAMRKLYCLYEIETVERLMEFNECTWEKLFEKVDKGYIIL